MKKTVKRISAIIMICIIIISSLSFQVPDRAYAGDPLTIATTSSILEALRNVLTGVALGRAGLKSSSSASDVMSALHEVEDDIGGGNELAAYLMSPAPWMAGANYIISKAFDLVTYQTYCNYNQYDYTDTSVLNLYLTSNNLGSLDITNNSATVDSKVVNKLSDEIEQHYQEMVSKLDDILASYAQAPIFEEFKCTYGIEEVTISMQRVLTSYNIPESNYSLSTKDFMKLNLNASFQNALGQFSGFDIINKSFVLSTDGTKIRLFQVFDNSILMHGGQEIYDYESFLYDYCKKVYNSNVIYNDQKTYYSKPYASNYNIGSFANRFPNDFSIWEYNISSPSLGWRQYTSSTYSTYEFNSPVLPAYYSWSLSNNYYVNFSKLNNVIMLNTINNNYMLRSDVDNYPVLCFTENYPTDMVGSYSLFQGVGIVIGESSGISVTGEDTEDDPLIPTEVLDRKAPVTIDINKTTEINNAFENGVSEGTEETYTDISPEIVESLASLLYKTSDIFKVVSVISGAISSTKSIVGNIKSGVEDLPTDISTAFSGYFTDSTTGETILSRLIPLSSIASVISNLPTWFVDSTTNKSFASQTAAGVVSITDALDVSDIDIDDEDQEYPATIGGIMARIAAKVGEISTTLDGIAEDEEEDEEALDIPLSISTAISTDITAPNGKRSSSDINKLAILPLLFILILLLIIWLMLKVLAFVVLIFKTPVSTAFLSNGMISGLNWLKSTKITSGGGTLSMANGTGLAQAGSFINISIWSLMIFLVDLIALFAIVKVIKKWADRLHGG